MVYLQGESPVICRDVIVNGFHTYEEVGQAIGIFLTENAVISNFWIESNRNTTGGAGLVAVSSGDAVMNRVFIRDNYSESYTALYLFSGGKLGLSNSEITNNSMGGSWGRAGILNENGGTVTVRNSKLFKNAGGENFQIFNQNGGLVDIDQSTIQSGRAGVHPVNAPENIFIKWGARNTAY